MYEKFGLFLDGQWKQRSNGGQLDVSDPGTGEIIGHVPSASKQDVLDALASAEAGLKIWRKTSAWARADILHSAATVMQNRSEEAARRITLETGKPIAQARR